MTRAMFAITGSNDKLCKIYEVFGILRAPAIKKNAQKISCRPSDLFEGNHLLLNHHFRAHFLPFES